MPTAHDLYRDILEFLARRTIARSEGPHDLSEPEGNMDAPDWNGQAPTTVPTYRPLLLPLTTIGKGELAVQAALYSHLICKRWNAVTEAAPDQKSDRIDILVLDNTFSPLAVIELKHYSIHQTWKPPSPCRLLTSMDADIAKRGCQSIYGYLIQKAIPIIRVGLMTAIISPSAVTLRRASPPPFPSFLKTRSYISTGAKDTLSAFSPPWKSNTSAGRFQAFMPSVLTWYKSSSSAAGHAGWGPRESFFHDPSKTFIDGYVGYVCVMS